MSYHERLAKYFRDKGISNVEISKKVDYSPLMVGRYLRENKINIEFINAITKAYPDIDWNFVLKEEVCLSGVEEGNSIYEKSPKNLLNEIEIRIKELKKWHESDTEKQ